MKSPASGRSSSSKLSSYSRGFDLPDYLEPDNLDQETDNYGVGGAMLSVFLNDLRHNNQQDLVEVTLELNDDDSIVVCSVAPTTGTTPRPPAAVDEASISAASGGGGGGSKIVRSLSNASRSIRRKFPWLRSSAAPSSRASTTSDTDDQAAAAISARDARRIKAKLQRTRSTAQRALNGLRFINKTTGAKNAEELWKRVESKFDSLSKNGLISRDDFGECIGIH